MKGRKICVHNLKPGDVIKVDLDEWGSEKRMFGVGGIRTYKVLKKFEIHILCESMNGYPWKESFQYFKLKSILVDVQAA